MQHRKETRESYEELSGSDVLKHTNGGGVATKYGAIKP